MHLIRAVNGSMLANVIWKATVKSCEGMAKEEQEQVSDILREAHQKALANTIDNDLSNNMRIKMLATQYK